MKNRLKIVEINGFRGLLLMLFIVACAITGFVLAPSWFLMKVYNHFASDFYFLHKMNLAHGGMLWAIIVLSIYAMNRDKVFVSCKSPQIISGEDMKNIIEKSKNVSGQPIRKLEEEKLTKNRKEEAKK